MRERKYVKFRVDMYEDTKFKIIDMNPERDVIHYVWSRLLLLAGKVNLEGDLYFSRSTPYTIETLAIEFNRDVEKIKLALEVFIELEMVELTEDKVYKVKNFTKHQNIKAKGNKALNGEKSEKNNIDKVIVKESQSEIDSLKKEEDKNKINSIDKTISKEDDVQVNTIKNEALYIEVANKEQIREDANGVNLPITNKEVNERTPDKEILNKETPILLERKSGTRRKKKKKREDIVELASDEDILDESSGSQLYHGEPTLRNDEVIINKWKYV